MLRQLAVLVIAAFCLVQAVYYDVKTADQDYLQKQKKIYNLLYHISQPTLVNPELYEEGHKYNIEENIDSYTNKDAVKEFLSLYHNGMLARGDLFSPYYPKLMKESAALFYVFFYAKDFDTFYKTALWARTYVNEGQFCYALYNAVLRRPDTKYIQLPEPYELYPYSFFNSEVIEKAHHAKLFGKLESEKSEGYNTYVIYANYSGWYLNREYDEENKLNYFTEDIGLNTFYFFLKQDLPFWMKSDILKKPTRGREYLYSHKQLLSRYYLERISNDLVKLEDFDWSKPFPPGYYPTMTFHNGMPLPQRPCYSDFPYYKYKYIEEIKNLESRAYTAIDAGFVVDNNSNFINIRKPEGLDILGNAIEGNTDSPNFNFYGSIDHMGRKIFGFNVEPSTVHHIVPSALEFDLMSLRDPAFYRLQKKILLNIYYRYKYKDTPYTKDAVVFPNLKIESFNVDKLTTYFEKYDASISNGMLVESQQEAENVLIKVRQYRLNHKPFSFHFTVNSDKAVKAAVRIFLGPKSGAYHKTYDCTEDYKYFYEIDNWIVDLNAGENKFVRDSKDCFFVIPDFEPSEVFYKKVLKAINGGEALKYNERVYGFPERLLLPKGKKEGMPFQFFIHVSPVIETINYESRVWGEYTYDNKEFGYPFDRPVQDFCYEGPNMIFKDVLIYHKDDIGPNYPY